MTDNDNTQDSAAMPPASAGSVAGEPAAWAVLTADGKGVLHTSCTKQGSVGWKRAMERQGEVVPLYRSPTLTDAERWAVSVAMGIINEGNYGWPDGTTPPQDTLRGLLDRLAGGPEREQPARKGEATPARSVETGGDSPDRE